MPFNTEFLIETPFRTFRVRVEHFGMGRLTEAQREDGRRLAMELRYGLDNWDPGLLHDAQLLYHEFDNLGPFQPRVADASFQTRRYFDMLSDFLETQLRLGLLVVIPEPERELTAPKPRVEPQPPELRRSPRAEPLQTDFEVRFVDEIGQGIAGLKVEIRAGDRTEQVTTNAAGVALLEGTTAGSGTVTVSDLTALEKILEPRWAKRRIGKASGGLNTTEQLFDGRDLDTTTIKGGVPNTVVIKPKLGTLSAELWDKSGRVRHANRDYTIDGPMQLSGTTDQAGQLFHADVFPGDYELTLKVEVFEGEDKVTDTYKTALVVQRP